MAENRKTMLVKRLLKEALIDLLNEKEIHKISVKELSEVADINRSTFYSHYEDIYQLLDEITEEYLSKIKMSEAHELTVSEIMNIIDYMYEHKRAYIPLLKSGKYREYLFNKSMKVFDQGTLQNGTMVNANRELYKVMVNYTLAGSEAIILEFLCHDIELTAKHLAYIIHDINNHGKNIVINRR